jgi:hypothetical protein
LGAANFLIPRSLQQNGYGLPKLCNMEFAFGRYCSASSKIMRDENIPFTRDKMKYFFFFFFCGFLKIIFKFFYYYSYVHTMLGSFLPPEDEIFQESLKGSRRNESY